jgi:hypothetical protein
VREVLADRLKNYGSVISGEKVLHHRVRTVLTTHLQIAASDEGQNVWILPPHLHTRTAYSLAPFVLEDY